MKSDFSDVRFIDFATETIELNYTLIDKTDSTTARFRVNNLNVSQIYMYYGNAAVSTTENASDVYLGPEVGFFFDNQNAEDFTTNGHDATVFGADFIANGHIGGGYEFVAANTDYIKFDTTLTEIDANGDYSFNIWIAPDLDQNQMILSSHTNSNNRIGFMLRTGDIIATSYDGSIIKSGGTWTGGTSGTFVMVTLVHHADNSMEVYQNTVLTTGTSAATATPSAVGTVLGATTSLNDNWFDGEMDEPYFYNRILTTAEIEILFEQNKPSFTVGAEQTNLGVATTLISPEDNQNILNNTVDFNFTSIPTQTNLTNTTLYIWYNNGTLFDTNFTTLSGNESLNTTLTNTLADGMYEWNAETCGEGVDCSFASSNNSFIVHVTPITIDISEPNGTIPYILLGDNETLTWKLTEPGENLTEHLINCSFTYNSIITYLPLNTCIVTNTTEFTYVLGVDTLMFNTTDIFNLTSNQTTSWNYIITEINQTYDEIIFETFSNNFQINMSSTATSITNPKLIYKNATYTTELNIINSTNFYLNSSVVTNNSLVGNNSFFWNITLDGTEYSIPARNQTVGEINFSICGGSNNVTYLSIDFLDELTLESINGTIRTSDFNYYVDDADAFKTFIFGTADNQSQYDFCFTPSVGTIINDFSISYYGDIYPERTFGSVFELTNETTNLTLNLLDESSGIYATFGFIDATSKVGLADVFVLIFEGVNLVVEKITDDSGLISEWLNPNILYEIQFTKTGYEGGSQSHRPISTETINIQMVSDALISSPSLTNGLVTYYYPQLTSLDENTNYSFGFYSSEGEESISLMKFTLYDEDRNIIYQAEQSGDGNMSQQIINTTQNKTLLGIYEINGTDGGYWIFHKTFYVAVITASDYSLAQWGLSFDSYFPADTRTTLTKLIWFVLWIIVSISGFTYGYNGSFSTQDDYRQNISSQTRSNTSVGLFFAFIITWVFCYFNMIPVALGLNPILIPEAFLNQYFMAILFLVVLVADVSSSLSKHNRRGT